jgi:hypothetical protein
MLHFFLHQLLEFDLHKLQMPSGVHAEAFSLPQAIATYFSFLYQDAISVESHGKSIEYLFQSIPHQPSQGAFS